MKKLVVLLLAILVATSAMAQIDPDPNSIGIYFDEGATNNCGTPPLYASFMAYVCLANPTDAAVGFYEFGYENVSSVGANFTLAFQVTTLGYDCVDCGTVMDMGGGTAYVGEHRVGLGIPMPTSPVTILHAWQMAMYAEQSVEMYLFQSAAPSIDGSLLPAVAYYGSGDPYFVECGLSTGAGGGPVAVINGDCGSVVPVESASFGNVKSLFR